MRGESKADIYKAQLINFIENLEDLKAENEHKKDKPKVKPTMLAADKLIGSITDLYNYVDNNFDGISKEAINKIQDAVSEIVKDNNLDDYETLRIILLNIIRVKLEIMLYVKLCRIFF